MVSIDLPHYPRDSGIPRISGKRCSGSDEGGFRIELAALKVDGGASANDFLMQTQADIINAPVNRPQCVETTAMGAAYLAGLAVGYWSSKEDVIKNWAID